MKLKIENLTKEYNGKKVLDIENLVIEQGTLTAIIGANGAGKTTLINIIGRLDSQTTGKVSYMDHDLIKTNPRAAMTLVFQNPYLISTTVEKNIAYPLKLRGWSRFDIEERINQLTEELGLEKLRKRKVWKLSGGEIQKVALARALSFKPELLLLDEPTANIDPTTTGEIERMLAKINEEEGTGIILVTHNLPQAKRVCNKLIFLNKGELVEEGNCLEILKNPANGLTRQFIEGELLV